MFFVQIFPTEVFFGGCVSRPYVMHQTSKTSNTKQQIFFIHYEYMFITAQRKL